ncbi:MAG: 50S ribosomal protein L24 [Candidatus Izimaplasma sp.]|nr:50S ribosomal protein L24 [Candidatus Izimaplasma bacterium]
MKLKKGDNVKVISGNYRGMEGKILKVFPKSDRVIVEGVNTIKKHSSPTQANPEGGILEYEAPIHASNVMFFEKKTGPTRVGYKTITEDGETRKVRVSKKSGEVLD